MYFIVINEPRENEFFWLYFVNHSYRPLCLASLLDCVQFPIRADGCKFCGFVYTDV